jgi:hypothetical protein
VKTAIVFTSGAIVGIISIPVAVVYVKPIRVAFTNGICKLASLGLKMAPAEEQRDFIELVKVMIHNVEGTTK